MVFKGAPTPFFILLNRPGPLSSGRERKKRKVIKMLDENYLDMIREMKEAGHFDENGKCKHCDVQIIGMTVSETEGAMRTHLKEEHGIKIEGW